MASAPDSCMLPYNVHVELNGADNGRCISQTNSHRPMNISKGILEELLRAHDVNEGFLQILSGFRWVAHTVEEALGSPFWKRQWESKDRSGRSSQNGQNREDIQLTRAEYAFVFRYAQQTDRKGAEPWSIRQCALYHQIRPSDKRSIYILINPYPQTEAETTLTHWLRNIADTGRYQRQLMRPAAMLLAPRLGAWRDYMRHYEEEITQMWTRLYCVGFQHPESVTPDDLRNLHFCLDRLSPLDAIFSAQLVTLEGLEQIVRRQCLSGDIVGSSCGTEPQDWREFFSNTRTKLGALRKNAASLIARCQNTLQLVDGAMKLENQRLMAQQSANVLDLTVIAVDDSATIRIMTTITLCFLSFATLAVSAPPKSLDTTLAISLTSTHYPGYLVNANILSR